MNKGTVKVVIISFLGVVAVVMLFLAAFQFFKPDRSIQGISDDENDMHVADDPTSALYVSEDAGETWRGVAGAEFAVTRLMFDVAVSQLLIGTAKHGMWKAESSNVLRVEPLDDSKSLITPDASIFDLAMLPNTNIFFVAARYKERSLLVSKDEKAWHELFFAPLDDSPIRAIDLDPFDATRIVFGSGTGFYMSEDAGETWSAKYRFRQEVTQLVAHPRIPGRYFVTTERGNLFVTSDFGATWEERTKQISKYRGSRDNQALYIDISTGIIYLTSNHGLLASYTDGTTWVDIPLIVPPDSLPITGFAVNALNPSIIYLAASSQLYKSEDGGKSWKGVQFFDKDIISAIAINPTNPDVVVIGFNE